MGAVTAFEQWFGQFFQLFGVDVAHFIGRFFNRSYFESLSFLDDLNKLGGLHQ